MIKIMEHVCKIERFSRFIFSVDLVDFGLEWYKTLESIHNMLTKTVEYQWSKVKILQWP